jgi:organic hydroperoxide reductase OsmC/OhrA
MLWALSIAAKQQFIVERYTDAAVGVMERNAAGRLAITRVTLRPAMIFLGPRTPTDAQIAQIHRLAHENCYIANSVTTEVSIEPVPQP